MKPSNLTLDPGIQTPDEPDPGLGAAAEERRRAEIGVRGGLRQRAARGTIINASFLVGINALGLLKGVVVAAFLTTGEYGVWGVLLFTVIGMLTLKQAGIGERYVQQDEADQHHAFQRAFTNELILTGAAMVLLIGLIPLLALAYGENELLAPGLVMALALPGAALQAPIWIFYRRMQYGRQRIFQAIDPVVSFVIAVGLAAAGFGYWALVLGTILGSWTAAIAILRASPLAPGWRFERASFQDYLRFSWPLMVAPLCAMAIAQGTLLVADLAVGLAAVGAISLASQISLYTSKLDEVISQTLYPAICAVKDRIDVLGDAFLKSNRLAILWGVPFGVGVAIFTPDLISFVIGEKWEVGETVIPVMALVAAVNQLGFNWNSFFQARGETKPLAVAALVLTAGVAVLALPLMATEGLTGFAIGIAAANLIMIAVRVVYLRHLFPRLPILRNAAAAALPTLPAAAIVLALRAVGGERGGVEALAEFGVFVALVAIATFALERNLLRESIGYLRQPATA